MIPSSTPIIIRSNTNPKAAPQETIKRLLPLGESNMPPSPIKPPKITPQPTAAWFLWNKLESEAQGGHKTKTKVLSTNYAQSAPPINREFTFQPPMKATSKLKKTNYPENKGGIGKRVKAKSPHSQVEPTVSSTSSAIVQSRTLQADQEATERKIEQPSDPERGDASITRVQAEVPQQPMEPSISQISIEQPAAPQASPKPTTRDLEQSGDSTGPVTQVQVEAPQQPMEPSISQISIEQPAAPQTGPKPTTRGLEQSSDSTSPGISTTEDQSKDPLHLMEPKVSPTSCPAKQPQATQANPMKVIENPEPSSSHPDISMAEVPAQVPLLTPPQPVLPTLKLTYRAGALRAGNKTKPLGNPNTEDISMTEAPAEAPQTTKVQLLTPTATLVEPAAKPPLKTGKGKAKAVVQPTRGQLLLPTTSQIEQAAKPPIRTEEEDTPMAEAAEPATQRARGQLLLPTTTQLEQAIKPPIEMETEDIPMTEAVIPTFQPEVQLFLPTAAQIEQAPMQPIGMEKEDTPMTEAVVPAFQSRPQLPLPTSRIRRAAIKTEIQDIPMTEAILPASQLTVCQPLLPTSGQIEQAMVTANITKPSNRLGRRDIEMAEAPPAPPGPLTASERPVLPGMNRSESRRMPHARGLEKQDISMTEAPTQRPQSVFQRYVSLFTEASKVPQRSILMPPSNPGREDVSMTEALVQVSQPTAEQAITPCIPQPQGLQATTRQPLTRSADHSSTSPSPSVVTDSPKPEDKKTRQLQGTGKLQETGELQETRELQGTGELQVTTPQPTAQLTRSADHSTTGLSPSVVTDSPKPVRRGTGQQGLVSYPQIFIPAEGTELHTPDRECPEGYGYPGDHDESQRKQQIMTQLNYLTWHIQELISRAKANSTQLRKSLEFAEEFHVPFRAWKVLWFAMYGPPVPATNFPLLDADRRLKLNAPELFLQAVDLLRRKIVVTTKGLPWVRILKEGENVLNMQVAQNWVTTSLKKKHEDILKSEEARKRRVPRLPGGPSRGPP